MDAGNKKADMLILGNDDNSQLTQPKKDELRVSLSGLNLPDNSTTGLEKQIKDLITEEIEKTRQETLEQLKKWTSPLSNEIPINISLSGLNLSEKSTSRLESQIKEIITTHIEKDNNQVGKNGKAVCVCAGCSAGGEPKDLSRVPHPFPFYPYTIGVFGLRGTFAVRLELIDPTQLSTHISPDQIILSFETPPQSIWEKQVKSYNCHLGSSVLLRLRDSFHGGKNYQARVQKSSCVSGPSGTDTLVFTAMRFLGGYYDLVNFDCNQFWYKFGGQRIHIEWIGPV